jgi:GNAT superfamily N-acetyltransferase
MSVRIELAHPEDAAALAVMVGELLQEISDRIGVELFEYDLQTSIDRARHLMRKGIYQGFLARVEGTGEEVGFVTLTEVHTLYAGGAFGVIPEMYVKPAYRCEGIGEALIRQAKALGTERGWTRLETTTPPLPEFERALRFYEWQGFAITGGHKMKALL